MTRAWTAEEPSFPRVVSFRSVVDWTDFDGKWRDRLAQEGLSYFRMADFSHPVGDFEPLGKQKERKRGLLVDLLGIISRNESVSYHGTPKSVEFTPPSDPSG
jgi:hypothetical protein